MERDYLPCERCGRKTKRMFMERRPGFVAVGAVAFIAAAAAKLMGLPDIWFGIGLFISGASFVSLLRVRCLVCEPQWKERAWGGIK